MADALPDPRRTGSRRAGSPGAVPPFTRLPAAAKNRQHRAAGNTKTIGVSTRPSGRAGGQPRAAALDEASGLSAGKHRPLRLGIDVLYPLHLADPALPGFDRPPHARPNAARRKTQDQRTRRYFSRVAR